MMMKLLKLRLCLPFTKSAVVVSRSRGLLLALPLRSDELLTALSLSLSLCLSLRLPLPLISLLPCIGADLV